MKCPKCGADNLDRATFCLDCGRRLRDEERPRAPLAPRLLVIAAVLGVIVVAIVAGVVVLAQNGDGEDAPAPEPLGAASGTDAEPRYTAITLLAGGPNAARIEPRAFEIIIQGVAWSEVGSTVFPGSEVDLVMVLQEQQSLSVGLGGSPSDPSGVDSLWREIGQPGRHRALYFAPVGDESNKRLEAWLRQQLTALGFDLVKDRSKARESVLFTITR
jgi:hypothetical protein